MFGRAGAGGFAEYLHHVNQLDSDPMGGGNPVNPLHGQGTTARILLGNGADPEAWRFLHDQLLMDMAPQVNEGNENIDGTKIYTIRTALARWIEESTVLDGPYVHDTVLALKSKLTEPIEKQYESELQVLAAKKAKDDEERKKRAEEKARQDQERAQAAAAAAAAASAATASQPAASTETSSSADATNTTTSTAVAEPVDDIVMTSPTPLAAAASAAVPTETMSTGGQSPTAAMEVNHPSPPKEPTTTTTAETDSTTSNAQPATTTAEEPPVEWTTLVVDGREFRVPKECEIDPSFLAALPEEMRQEVLTDLVRNFEREESQRRAQRAAALAAANPTAAVPPQGAEGTNTDGFSARANASGGAAAATGNTTTEAAIGEMLGEINAEFISALPPEIRDELLAERRRTAAAMAAMSGVNLPDSGPAEFLRTLQPHLRQQVLADMDESQIGALPDDIATEARALRAAMENQQQQYFRDRMVRTQHDMMNMLTNPTHHSTRPIRMYNLRAIQETRGNRTGSNWYTIRPGGNPNDLNSNTLAGGTRGRQLLDYESICCLLVLLFIDDQRLSLARLQKILKNLCHHQQTRQWVIKALLSIINKSTGRTEFEAPTSTPGAPTLVLRTPTGATTNENQQVRNINPSWLTINFESAFGARTNVFKIQRVGPAKRHGSLQISVHAQACPIVCRQVLDALILLARSFPDQFLPSIQQTVEPTATPASQEQLSKGASPDKPTVSTPSKSSPNIRDLSFWELLLKLDQSFTNRTNRSTSNPMQNLATMVLNNPNNSQRAPSTLNVNANATPEIDFDSSPLAILLLMLDHPIMNKNNQLMDKLFRLLLLISQSFQNSIIAKKETVPSPLAASTPMTNEPAAAPTTTTAETAATTTTTTSAPPTAVVPTPEKLVISDDQVVLGAQLDLVIKALISKSCTEEGLESATMLLLNISKINQATRDKVLHLLLNGIRHLGKDISEEIKNLLLEVQDYLTKNKSAVAGGNAPGNDDDSSSAPIDESSKLFDSFRSLRSNTVTTANADPHSKQQDLQLPAMVMLTAKTANQQFLLRILKVIIQLREATKKEQLDAQSHFDSELHTLTRRLETLRQSLRSYFPTDPNNEASSNDILQPIDHLATRLEQMRTRLQTVLNSHTAEQRQLFFSQNETANDIQDIHRLIQQLETVMETFHEPGSTTAMTTRINDVLQTIPPLLPALATEPMDVGSLQDNKLTDLLNINQLWDSLSECLMALAKLPDPHAVLVLQPAVEAFFLVHAADLDNEQDKQTKKKKDRETREALSHLECFGPAPTTTASDRGAPDEPVIAPSTSTDGSSPTVILRTGASNSLSTNELPPDAQKFVEFARTHRTVLNQILRQSTQHLSEGPFHILTDYTSILDFDVKRKYFRHELDRLKESIRGEDLAVHVRRNHVFEDSYRELNRRPPDDWKHRFYIVFDGEEGQDAGGLLREWYAIIARSMFDPNYALFMINPGDRVTYMPNPLSHCNPSHTQYFKFIGRIIAKAIFDNKYMDCYFTRSFYKHILGIPVRYSDMESVDMQFYKNLMMLLDNDIHQLGLELTFLARCQRVRREQSDRSDAERLEPRRDQREQTRIRSTGLPRENDRFDSPADQRVLRRFLQHHSEESHFHFQRTRTGIVGLGSS